MLCITILR